MPEGEPGGAGGQPPPPPSSVEGPKVTEELDWRARALEAEEKVKQLEAQVGDAQARAAQAEAALSAAQRQWTLERELAASGVIDAEAAAILAGSGAGPGADGQTFDARAVVAELRKKRPYLFAPANAPPRASAMSGAITAQPAEGLSRAAEEARATGDLGTLLKYLRMRRA